jgi:hypothetical protein
MPIINPQGFEVFYITSSILPLLSDTMLLGAFPIRGIRIAGSLVLNASKEGMSECLSHAPKRRG